MQEKFKAALKISTELSINWMITSFCMGLVFAASVYFLSGLSFEQVRYGFSLFVGANFIIVLIASFGLCLTACIDKTFGESIAEFLFKDKKKD